MYLKQSFYSIRFDLIQFDSIRFDKEILIQKPRSHRVLIDMTCTRPWSDKAGGKKTQQELEQEQELETEQQ